MNPWLFTVECLCPLEGLISKYIVVIVLSVNIFVSVQLSHFYWNYLCSCLIFIGSIIPFFYCNQSG
jgi:hypothetical protein